MWKSVNIFWWNILETSQENKSTFYDSLDGHHLVFIVQVCSAHFVLLFQCLCDCFKWAQGHNFSQTNQTKPSYTKRGCYWTYILRLHDFVKKKKENKKNIYVHQNPLESLKKECLKKNSTKYIVVLNVQSVHNNYICYKFLQCIL